MVAALHACANEDRIWVLVERADDHGFRLRTWPELTEIWARRRPPVAHSRAGDAVVGILVASKPHPKSPAGGAFLALSCFFIEPGARRNAVDGIGFAGHDVRFPAWPEWPSLILKLTLHMLQKCVSV
jgi:hypothetical protein